MLYFQWMKVIKTNNKNIVLFVKSRQQKCKSFDLYKQLTKQLQKLFTVLICKIN